MSDRINFVEFGVRNGKMCRVVDFISYTGVNTMVEESKFLRQARMRLVNQEQAVKDLEAALAVAQERKMSATIVAVTANLGRARAALNSTRMIIDEYSQPELPLKVRK